MMRVCTTTTAEFELQILFQRELTLIMPNFRGQKKKKLNPKYGTLMHYKEALRIKHSKNFKHLGVMFNCRL